MGGDWLVFPGEVALKRENILSVGKNSRRRTYAPWLFQCQNLLWRRVPAPVSYAISPAALQKWIDGDDSVFQPTESGGKAALSKNASPEELLQMFSCGKIDAAIYERLLQKAKKAEARKQKGKSNFPN